MALDRFDLERRVAERLSQLLLHEAVLREVRGHAGGAVAEEADLDLRAVDVHELDVAAVAPQRGANLRLEHLLDGEDLLRGRKLREALGDESLEGETV